MAKDDGKTVAGGNPMQGNDQWNPTLRLQFGGRIEYTDVTIDSDDPLLTSLKPGRPPRTGASCPPSASGGVGV